MSEPLDPALWEVYARVYDPGVTTLHPYKELHAQVMARLRACENMRVVDAGCGTAYYATSVAQQLPATVIALESNKGMLDVARPKARGVEGFSVVRHDFNTMPWPNVALDLTHVISINMLYALAEPDTFLAQAFDALIPGGQLLLANLWRPDMRLVFGEHYMWLLEHATPEQVERDVRLQWARHVVIALNKEIVRASAGKKLGVFTPDELQMRVERAGFLVSDRQDQLYAGTSVLVQARKP